MATYLVEPDTYAGWSAAGRGFTLAGLVAGAVALLAWVATHEQPHRFGPYAPSDQLLLQGMVWIGGAVFAVMAVAVAGSIMLSVRSRGTVTITDEGVVRQSGRSRQMLEWPEIKGFVALAHGGVTLVSDRVDRDIVIPRFMDDYRECIAELKAHNIQSLSSSHLRRRRSLWYQGRKFAGAVSLVAGFDARLAPGGRIAGVCLGTALLFSLMMEDRRSHDRNSLRWSALVIFTGVLIWILQHLYLS